MNKETTITGVLIALAIAAVNTIGNTILENKDLIELAGYLFLLTAFAAGLTWGIVELFKRMRFDPDTRARLNRPYIGKVRDPDWKRRDQVYFSAVITGFLATEAMGSVFLLMDGATRKMVIVVVILWTLYSFAVGLLIPMLYRKIFYKKIDPEALL